VRKLNFKIVLEFTKHPEDNEYDHSKYLFRIKQNCVIMSCLLNIPVSGFMFTFYLTEYVTLSIRGGYFNETSGLSFERSAPYRTAVCVQLIINIVLLVFLILWLWKNNVRLVWKHPSPSIAAVLIVCLLVSEIAVALLADPKESKYGNLMYWLQLFIDLGACIFTLLYFTFDRVIHYNNQRLRSEPSSEEPNGGTSLLFDAPSSVPINNQRTNRRRYYEKRVIILVSCILHFILLVIGLIINVVHEVKMTSLDLFYLATVIENILLFEILHIGIELVWTYGASNSILAGHS